MWYTRDYLQLEFRELERNFASADIYPKRFRATLSNAYGEHTVALIAASAIGKKCSF